MSLKNGLNVGFAAIFLFLILLPVFGQEDADDDDSDGSTNKVPISSTWTADRDTLYSRGDQTFTISLGVLFPLFVTDVSGDILTSNINLGGLGALSYSYFINSKTFFGAELQGSFAQTLSKNFLYFIPIGIKAGYQFVYHRFEFPISLTMGGITEQYISYNLYCFYLKPQVSGFFRFNPDWSFGLNAAWWWVPQWTNDSTKNTNGNFLEISLSARYHF